MSGYETYQLLNSLDSDSYGSSYSTMQGMGIWGIIALVLAIVGGILVFFLFTNAKTDPKNKFAKWLKDFLAFKVMWIEGILKVVYYAATIFVMLYSFSFLALGGVGFLMFLIFLVAMPIIIRIFYEATMMFIMIWHNTKDIAENTKKK